MVAVFIIAVLGLVLSCVAITISTIDKSDGMNSEEVKRFDDLEKRMQNIELQVKTPGNDNAPPVTEIMPIDVFQISVYQDRNGQYPFQRAIDGNEATLMHTNSHTNPWWCADMGGIYHMSRVTVTNVASQYSVRATNLRVGVTNVRPEVGKSLALDAYTLCEEKPGLMGKIGIVQCPDGVSGQYLVVQLRTTTYMHFTEVKIYGFEIKP